MAAFKPFNSNTRAMLGKEHKKAFRLSPEGF
jgi:hypothetical protein